MSSTLDLPVIEIEALLNRDGSPAAEERYAKECAKVAESLRDYGCLLAKDPRATAADNDK